MTVAGSPTAGAERAIALTADGTLLLFAAPSARDSLAEWLPRSDSAGAHALPAAELLNPVGFPGSPATILVGAAEARHGAPTADGPLLLSLGGARAHLLAPGHIALRGEGAFGEILLDESRAALTIGAPSSAEARAVLGAMATIASALLLARLGRALVHAAGVLDADGRAWLLAGDSHSGKTSTCATLIEGGWRYLSDDHVVLWRAAGGELLVEGWPRSFHLDSGWTRGASEGLRTSVDSFRRWPGAFVRCAPLGGVIVPRVTGAPPTVCEGASSATALVEMVRQSPWLLADATAAPTVLTILAAAARLAPHALSLAHDSFARPEVLLRSLDRATFRL